MGIARKPFIRLHLSTCVVLMLVAALLVWVNMTGTVWQRSGADRSDTRQDVANFKLGWPCTIYERITEFPVDAGEGIVPNRVTVLDLDTSGGWWRIGGLCLNLAAMVCILAATAIVIEWSIRRRARHLTNDSEAT